MALEMKRDSRWWYGRFLVNGKLRQFPLLEKRGGTEQRIEIRGIRPESLKHPEDGDAAFLESFHRARAAHDRLQAEVLSRKYIEEQAQRIIEAKTGTRFDSVRLEAIPDAWAAIPRKRQPCKQHLETSKGRLRRFVSFMRQHHPEVDDLASVRAEHVRAFLDQEDRRGIAPRTWNVTLMLLRTVFRKLEPNSEAYRAFLKDAAAKEEDTVHREPFTEEEIEAILGAAQGDELMRPLIVTALCTAMRRGDCALLKWSSVDLDAGFIEVRTSKTGQTAEIPILPALREELGRRAKTKSGPFVFPEAAKLYEEDSHQLDRRLRVILAQAGFADEMEAKDTDHTERTLPTLPLGKLRRKGLAAIASGTMIEARACY